MGSRARREHSQRIAQGCGQRGKSHPLIDEEGIHHADPWQVPRVGHDLWVTDVFERLHRFVRRPWFAVGLVTAINLWILRPELRDVTTRSDLTVHRTLIDWAVGRIDAGHFPIDGWFPRIGLGFPMMHQYQTLPHLLSAFLAIVIGVGNSSRWTTFVIVGTWPVAVYLGCRLMRLSVGTAIVAAALAPMVASNPSYGFEQSSYVWRGLGLWAQQWGMWMFPIAMGYAWRAITERRNLAAAAASTAFVMCTHLQTGYMLAMVIGAMAIVSFVDLRGRLFRMVIIIAGSLAMSSWLLVPVFADQKWSANTQYNANTVWVDSYGWRKVMGWLFDGQLFDRDHPPVLTVLVLVGLVVVLLKARRDPFCRMLAGFFIGSMILFCGKDPFGPVISLLPGISSLLLHRFISGVHMAGVLIAAIGVVEGGTYLWRELRTWQPRLPTAQRPAYELAFGLVLVLAFVPAINVTDSHERQAASWMKAQKTYDATEGAQVDALVATALARGGGRIYAGLLGDNGGEYYVGGSRTQTVIQEAGPTDVLGYSLRIPSLLADVEVRFDQSNPWHYELFNVRWVIQPAGRNAPPNGTLVETQGRHELYRIENATGYIGVVDVKGSYPAKRDNVGIGAETVLRQDLVGTPPVLPVVTYANLKPVASTVVPGETAPPGTVVEQTADGDAGNYTATVNMAREGYTMLRVAYHPRMKATVDGVEQPTVMIAPAFVGVLVPAGTHTIAFTYHAYPNYVPLFLVLIVAIAALVLLDRRWRGRHLAPIETPPLFPDAEPAMESEASEGDAVDEHPVAFGGGGFTSDA
jgi:hypothetical protein